MAATSVSQDRSAKTLVSALRYQLPVFVLRNERKPTSSVNIVSWSESDRLTIHQRHWQLQQRLWRLHQRHWQLQQRHLQLQQRQWQLQQKHWQLLSYSRDTDGYSRDTDGYSRVGLHRIWLFQIRPKPNLAEFRNSNSAEAEAKAEFGWNLFSGHRTIRQW